MAWSDNTLQSAPNVVGDRKLKALIFYTINPLLIRKMALCVFEPPLWAIGATYAFHLRLTGKPVVDFLLVTIELFSLGVTADKLRPNID